MANKEDAKQVVDLSLIPVGTVIQAADARNRGGLVGVRLDPNARVVANTEQVVDDLESLVLGRVVDGSDIADLGVLGGGVVLEEREDGNDTLGRDVDGQFVLPDRESTGVSTTTGHNGCKNESILLDVFRQARQQVLAVLVESLALLRELVRRVDNGCLQRARVGALRMLV